uniref:Phospholipase A2 n=1 Tax=Athene cunicularia TaxID=194338 RepID=A0A663NEQ3_ATHCN
MFKTSPAWYQFGGRRARDAAEELGVSVSPTDIPPPGLSPAHGSLWNLHKMITKTTGKNALLHYSSYGCYCGWGGKGQPKDATDRCCQRHDTCYNNLLSYHCNAKIQGYHYGWRRGSPSCSNSWCAQLSCECDRSLALCLKQNIWTYSKRYLFYPKHRC